jgi:predicted PurR-regulated permease PerM
MDFFVWMIVIGVVVSVVGWILWVVFFVWLAKVFISAAERNVQNTMTDLETMLNQIPRGPNQLDANQQAAITQMFMQAQSGMGQLNDLSRQRYETRMGDLMGMAGEAGIDWTPPPY